VIDQSLGERDKLLKRTQLDRKSDREDEQVFDDTDFYHLLLKDVIDSRGEGVNWMEIQKKKKTKKNVDTRASKGRKIRYEVHEKLQNFMVPIPELGRWPEEQIDELFASLLGKGFEGIGDAKVEERAVAVNGTDVMTDGFRVFG
jgi:protein AATF/BFR2